jgi:hypothetical protein
LNEKKPFHETQTKKQQQTQKKKKKKKKKKERKMSSINTPVWQDNLALFRQFLFSDDAKYGVVHQTSALVDLSEFNRRAARAPPAAAHRLLTDRESVRELQVYMRFAAAAYGWSLFTLHSARTDLLMDTVVRGHTVAPNRRILARHCHVDVAKDLVSDKWTSSEFDPGHFLLVSHAECAVVLAIRGTLHLADVASDMMARMVPMPGAPAGTVHSGILKCAQAKLAALLPTIRATLALHPTYKLVITGHSLGAGTAAIMAVLLNLDRSLLPANTKVRCFAFAVPAVFSYDIATSRELCGNIVSLAAGDDCVPRLCLGSMKRLQILLSDYIGANRRSAIGRMWKAGVSALRRNWKLSAAQQAFLDAHLGPPALAKLIADIEANNGDPSDSHVGPDWAVSFPPGLVWWIRTTNAGRRPDDNNNSNSDDNADDADADVNAAESSSAATTLTTTTTPSGRREKATAFVQRSVAAEFGRLIVSWTMITDHMPDFYEAMLRAAEDALLLRALRVRCEVLGATGLRRHDSQAQTTESNVNAQAAAQIRGREFPRFNTSLERTALVKHSHDPRWTDVFDWRLESDYLGNFESVHIAVNHVATGVTGAIGSLTSRELIGSVIVPLLPLFPELARPSAALADTWVSAKVVEVPIKWSAARASSSTSDRVDDKLVVPPTNIDAEQAEEEDEQMAGMVRVRLTAHFCRHERNAAIPLSSENEESLNKSLDNVPELSEEEEAAALEQQQE